MKSMEDAVFITAKEFAIAEYYFANSDSCTVWELCRIFKTGTKEVDTSIKKYMKLKKVHVAPVPAEDIKWDEHELDGVFNPEQDFRKLINFE